MNSENSGWTNTLRPARNVKSRGNQHKCRLRDAGTETHPTRPRHREAPRRRPWSIHCGQNCNPKTPSLMPLLHVEDDPTPRSILTTSVFARQEHHTRAKQYNRRVIGKAQGAVLCAHCRKPGGRGMCTSCELSVCRPCAADHTTCHVPCARELRLGIGARLRRVDSSGRYGLVSHLFRRPRLVDLCKFTLAALPRRVRRNRHLHPILTASRQLVTPEYRQTTNGLSAIGISVLSLDDETQHVIHTKGSQPLAMRMCRNDRIVSVTRYDETVALYDLRSKQSTIVRPMGAEVIQDVELDSTDMVMACSTYGRIDLDRVGTHGLENITSLYVANTDIPWLALSRHVLTYIARTSRTEHQIVVQHLHSTSLPAGKSTFVYPSNNTHRAPLQRPIAASMTNDAQFLAIALANQELSVINLRSGQQQSLSGHRDTITLVAFSTEGNQLVSADNDGRVIVRPYANGEFVSTYAPVSLTRK